MKPFFLNPLATVHQLYQQWERHFPFLKLRIYSPSYQLMDENTPQVSLQALSSTAEHQTELQVDPNMSVRLFLETFQNTFGLRAEVLRHSGYSWDETENTDLWTLTEQNQKGKEQSQIYRTKES
ncbi:hypothetical protein [Runella salmonicolor]|uniref:Uncharacterized protein n=1 Tax=Runella salmonicolor TaxID=2950278 RepID=A0ABT1FK60_9BACT|nr:hypothetical protein [Runella salmonicolor]MCP1382163.1 hypothetical protein [Runella salmonicolor]